MAKKKDGGTTKADAVREALKEGIEAPSEGVAFVKERFGLEMTAQQFSTYKSIEKKRAGNGGSRRTGSGEAPARKSARLPVPAPKNGSISEDLTALKELVHRYGADEVGRLVTLVGG
jgi:hypothetical protein